MNIKAKLVVINTSSFKNIEFIYLIKKRTLWFVLVC